jgi:hypothetical protein
MTDIEPTAANIGRLLYREEYDKFVVYCAACGAGKAASATVWPAGLIIDLKAGGWRREGAERLWRCLKCAVE